MTEPVSKDALIVVDMPAIASLAPRSGNPVTLALSAMNHHCPACNHTFWHALGGWQAFVAHIPGCMVEHPEFFADKGGSPGD